MEAIISSKRTGRVVFALGMLLLIEPKDVTASPIAMSTQTLRKALECCVVTSPQAITFSGAAFGFRAPNPPYQEGNLSLQIAIGYGDPSNTVGDLLWHTGPGTYDLSSDPDFERFAELSENGVRDPLVITVIDRDAHRSSFDFASLQETLWGTYPSIDFGPNRILGLRLNVLSVGPFQPPDAGIVINLETVCTPEPASLATMTMGMLFLLRRTRTPVEPR